MTDLWSVIAEGVRPEALLHTPADGTAPVPHGELLAGAERTAGQIVEALDGRVPRRLAVLQDNGEPWLRGMLATWRLGATLVPLPLPVAFAGPAAYVEQLRRIVADAELDAVLVGGTYGRLLGRMVDPFGGAPMIDIAATAPSAPLPSSPKPAQLAVIQYTSGSTSRPKGVMLSHDNVVAGLSAMRAAVRWSSQDVAGMWLPLFHDMGLFSLLMAFTSGSDLWLWRPQDFVRRPMTWLSDFAAAGATGVPAANFFYDMLAESADRDGVPSDLDLSRWRLGINGAEPVRRDSLERFEKTFGPYGLRPGVVQPTYGMAEATLMVSFAEPLRAVRAVDVDRDALSYGDRIRLDSGLAEQRRTVVSCGAPVDAVGVRIWAGPDSAPEEDVIGEIQISGPSVTSGYLNLAAEEQPLTPDGWLSTGDLGFLHEGELYVTGRLKDMIILRGQNYYAEDVEQVVRSTPGVHNRRAAAFAADTGAGDPGDGERMVVLWETRLDAAAAAQLADDIRRRLADQLNLHRVEIHPVQVSAIPCTSSGKVKRHAARNRWRNDNLGRVHSAAGRQGAEQ